jgi:hypothetical protein
MERNQDDRWRTAYHEAAHAVMGYLLRHEPRALSIVPSLHWSGVYFHRAPSIDEASLDGLRPREAPLAMQPPELRANLEGRILVALAGPAGEELYLHRQRFTRYRPTHEHDRMAATETVREFALTAEQRELLARGDDPEAETRDDYAKAYEWAELLIAEEEVGAYVQWLEVSARRIVRGPDFIRLVEALVPALLEHDELSGEAVADLLDRASGFRAFRYRAPDPETDQRSTAR